MNRGPVKCQKCGKPVYHAERKSSLGKDWHPACLRCEECHRVLSPGQHSEHKGIPYCTPCHKALFGPQLLGYGSNVYSPANYRKQANATMTNNNNNHKITIIPENNQIPYRNDTMQQVETYNKWFEGKMRQLSIEESETGGDPVISGPLRIYWGVTRPIQLRQSDEGPSQPFWRHSYMPPENGVVGKDTLMNPISFNTKSIPSPKPRQHFDDSALMSPALSSEVVMRRRKVDIRKSNTVAYRGDKSNKWKRASINGHLYNNDTRVFVPVAGSCTSVRVNNTMKTMEVIKTLLDKFKVENRPAEFSLTLHTESNGENVLEASDIPLLKRIELGPDESQAKIFIKEKSLPLMAWSPHEFDEATEPVLSVPIEERLPEDVEQLLILPDAVLLGVLHKYENDELLEKKAIVQKFERAKSFLLQKIAELGTTI